MAIDAAHRSSIYQSLVPILGEEDANVLMSEFPATEADELVTKGFLRAELADMRAELKGDIADVRAELKGDIADLRTELHTEIGTLRTYIQSETAALRTELHTEIRGLATSIGELRTEMQNDAGSSRTEIGSLRTEMADHRAYLEAALARQTRWVLGAVVGGMVAATTLSAAVG